MSTVRLTQTAKRAGTAVRQPPGFLLSLLGRLPEVRDPRVLFSASSVDDAAVLRLDETRAIVVTTDFFTPLVDDARDFGAIAAASALSRVYAMGGEPITALNIIGFPSATLEAEVLVDILAGSADKAREAGIDVVGGHTNQSDELFYGLAVTGIVDPRRTVTCAGGRPGDVLVLTKPIGVGIVATAAKQERDPLAGLAEAVRLMRSLNRDASLAMQDVGVSAATDVSGFGLLGSVRTIAGASRCAAVVRARAVPFLEPARVYADQGIAPVGTLANARHLADFVRWEPSIPKPVRILLCDAQTSGGLLVALPPESVDRLVAGLAGCACAAVVGELEAGDVGAIRVVV